MSPSNSSGFGCVKGAQHIFGTGLLDTVIPPMFLNCLLPGLILHWLLQFLPYLCCLCRPLLELRRLHGWITSMEDVSRGEKRFLTSVLKIWNDNVRWLEVQDFATGFLNLVLHLYPFSAVQLSHFYL